MRARVVVFPVRGRNWCFSRSVDPSAPRPRSATTTPSTAKALWKEISSNSKPVRANVELLVDFVSDKMNDAWTGIEKAPEGSFKSKIHGAGSWLLSHVKPSENFFKSISKDVTAVDVTYPSSLDGQLVRQRLTNVAHRGTSVHKKYMYGSASLLPLTSAFMLLPMPNIPFFWLLFRTYSHWRALQGSERLLLFVSNTVQQQEGDTRTASRLVLQPSKELDNLVRGGTASDGLNESAISSICKLFYLNQQEVLKYKQG